MNNPVVLSTVLELTQWCDQSESPIAAVLTMGALHDGHAQLVNYAKSHTPKGTRVVATIFVNPTQFNSESDFDQYPHALADDLEILNKIGVDAVFTPSVSQMYPNGPEMNSPIEPGELGEILEGRSRPGHFLGMLTIVHRLLAITQADYSFFGEKDFQQLTLVKTMVNQLALPIEIIGVPIVRDIDGLALSSRNRQLSPTALVHAKHIWVVMQLVAQAFRSGASAIGAQAQGKEYLERQGHFTLDYLEIRAENLVDLPNKNNARVFIAVTLQGVRLIDNLKIEE